MSQKFKKNLSAGTDVGRGGDLFRLTDYKVQKFPFQLLPQIMPELRKMCKIGIFTKS